MPRPSRSPRDVNFSLGHILAFGKVVWMEKIENEVRQFVVQNFLYGQDDKRLMRDSSLLDSGIIDSTGVLELIAFVEDKFGISVADDEMIPENLDSIENLAKFISRRQPA